MTKVFLFFLHFLEELPRREGKPLPLLFIGLCRLVVDVCTYY
jgi:hypothetical protein